MSYDYLTPSQVQADYIQCLEALKPELNPLQQDSDWFVRGAVVGGVVSGVYADQQKIQGDIFPQTARLAALQAMLVTWDLPAQIQPQPADGNLAVSGLNGTTYNIGLQFQHVLSGNVYQAVSGVTLVGTTGFVPVLSVGTGSNQNLFPGTPLTITNPPAGSTSTATVINMQDGRDLETTQEMATRILARIQFPPQGGTVADYQAWALAADPSVTSANIVRFIYGPGTVGVYLTAGTTNISQAVTDNIPIIRVPSSGLVNNVQTYINTQNPITDCAHVFPVTEVAINVIVDFALSPGLTPSTILQGQTLSCTGLIEQEVSRALYLLPAGGTQVNGTGYVLLSTIEQALDVQLGNTAYDTGLIAQILADRQVTAVYTGSIYDSYTNLSVSQNQVFKPGTFIFNLID